MLRLRLLGGFELRTDAGAPLPITGRRDRALLAYLALNPAGSNRAQLATLLWPDGSESQARKSLRQSLVSLRKTLNDTVPVLPADRSETPGLDPMALTVDVRTFESLARRGHRDSWQEATDLYRGAFLHGLDITDTPFQDWCDAERVRLEDMACGLLARLAESFIEEEAHEAALEAAGRLTALDPLRETGHRLLMRALAGAGRRAEALRRFHALGALLDAELGVRPDADTLALYHALRAGPGVAIETPAPAPVYTPVATLEGSRPGLVVLPLAFADTASRDEDLVAGLTEELVCALAAHRWFFVISALKAMTYSHRPVTLERLAAELAVRYVLSGKLRRAGKRLTLRMALQETARSEHLWSSSVECYADEAIEAQEQLAREVSRLIEPELLRHENVLALRAPPGEFDAWRQVVRARRLAERGHDETLAAACTLAREAVSMAPERAFAAGGLALVLWLTYKRVDRQPATLAAAVRAAEQAIELDASYYLGHVTLGGCRLSEDRHDAATASLRRAMNLNPSFPVSYNQLMGCLTKAGRPHDALSYIEPLDRVSPDDPHHGFHCCVRALTHFFTGNDAAAITNAERSLADHPTWLLSEVVHIAANQRAGRKAATRDAVSSFHANHDNLTDGLLRRIVNLKYERDFRLLKEQICAAGVAVR